MVKKSRKPCVPVLLALTLASIGSLSTGCGSSPTEPDESFVVVIAGGLVNVARNDTIQQFQADIDGKQAQSTTYAPARNLAELNVRSTLSRAGDHVLALSVPRQTVTSATYSTYSIVIVVSDMKGNIVYRGTPSDKTMAGMTTASRLEVPFRW